MIDKKLIQDLLIIPTQPSFKYINNKQIIEKVPRKQHAILQNLIKNHIDSYDYFVDTGLKEGISTVEPFYYLLPNGDKITVQVSNHKLNMPVVDKESFSRETRVFPTECRQRKTSYLGALHLEFCWYINDKLIGSVEEYIGDIPIMIKSKLCHLRNAGPKDMIKRKEDPEELGGYFISNGNERIIRMLIGSRRNYPIGISRSTWKDSFPFFSQYGVSMRCVGKGEKSQNMVLHYLTNGTAKLKIFYNARPITVPIIMILRALVDYSDLKIFKRIAAGYIGNESSFFKNSVISMMKMLKKLGISKQQDAIDHLGAKLKSVLELPSWWTDGQAGTKLLESSVAIHLNRNENKFNCLVLMLQKCFSIAKEGCALENEDNPMFHEIHTSGQIFFSLLIERIELFLSGLKMCFDKYFSTASSKKELTMSKELLLKLLRLRYSTIVNPLKLLIATGNLQSTSGIGLKQRVGLTVVCEKINYLRFLSNFRAVHRGAFFAEMRTTACRKLYPEAWGFLCPVHTPDGTPCGLLNHLTIGCVVTCNENTSKPIRSFIQEQEVIPISNIDDYDPETIAEYCYPITIDGLLVAYVEHSKANDIMTKLRDHKVLGTNEIPNDIEVCIIPRTTNPTQYPGFFIFTNIFRMMRPVLNRRLDTIEYIGSFEQVYMDINVWEKEVIPDRTTHSELSPTMFLSVLATLIPYPDFNQSPRNMYCCQMTKQTMGQASHTLQYRCDTKMYKIETPQTPLVRPAIYDHYRLDEFPLGTNAVVAVISYTGYDMEDAMIINKAAAERGFTTGSVMKTVYVDLKELGNAKNDDYVYEFGFASVEEREQHPSLDDMGLPYIGSRLESGNVYCAYVSTEKIEVKKTKVEIYKSSEVAYVQDVKLLSADTGKDYPQRVAITMWIPRRPFVGDKYANRHGQKGVCSLLWPQENMPFSESGMTPDIIFNPHGYPSRMTIGMMLESMSGKASAMTGECIDATPFRFSEDNTAGDNYGEMLNKAGFNYYGTEKMFSGIDGSLMTADIFVGLVYYIRLRHMVSDKFQVRSTGPIDQITHQPVKGRRRGGGVRFGEMERDSLLAHGTSFLLQDRLFNCSDKSIANACAKCGSLVTVSEVVVKQPTNTTIQTADGQTIVRKYRDKDVLTKFECRLCGSEQNCRQVMIPHVLTYLTAELAQVNIALKIDIGSI